MMKRGMFDKCEQKIYHGGDDYDYDDDDDDDDNQQCNDSDDDDWQKI